MFPPFCCSYICKVYGNGTSNAFLRFVSGIAAKKVFRKIDDTTVTDFLGAVKRNEDKSSDGSENSQ
jgi:hypothetical protein